MATSMNSLAKMVLAGMEESTPSSEDSETGSSGAHEGVPGCRRGGMAADASRQRGSAGVWLPSWLERRAAPRKSSSMLASLSSIRSIFFSLHGDDYGACKSVGHVLARERYDDNGSRE